MSIIPAITQKLEAEFNPELLDVYDESARHAGHDGFGDESHMVVKISAAPFKSFSRVERERRLHKLVIEAAGRDIHAVRFEFV